MNNDYEEDDEKYLSGDGLCRLYLKKNDRCFNIRRASGNGIHLIPRPLLAGVRNSSFYLCTGSSVYNAHGSPLGLRSHFRIILILKWIL